MAVVNEVLATTIGAHEQPEPYTYTFLNRDGTPRNLSGFEVAVVFHDPTTDTDTTYTSQVSWLDATAGEALFEWPDTLLDTPGNYSLTFWARIAGEQRWSGKPITVTVEDRGSKPTSW